MPNLTEHRLTKLEESLKEVVDNHLPHIQFRLDKIDDRMWQGGAAIIGILVSILITLLIK